MITAISGADARAVACTAVAALVALAAVACSSPRRDTASAVDTLASPAGPGSGEPDLAASADGRVYMTWLEPVDSAAGGGHALRLSTLNGDTWSDARTIRSGRDFFVNWADFPSIEVLGANRLAVHWLQRSGGGYDYGVRVAQSTDAGITWTQPVIPHRDTSSAEHGFVAMWEDAGRVGAVWLDGRKYARGPAKEMMLVSTSITSDGTLGAEQVLDDRSCDCCQNAVALTSAGPVVAYRNRSGDEIRDIYVTRRVRGAWTPGVPVHEDNWHMTACPVNGPSLDASGMRVALAWFTGARDTARVLVAFSSDAGASFAAPVRVDRGNPAGRVAVSLLGDHAALVTWIERTGGDTALVLARRVDVDGRVSPPITIAASSAARASGFPRQVVAGDRVVFAWTVPGSPSTVRVARMPVRSLP